MPLRDISAAALSAVLLAALPVAAQDDAAELVPALAPVFTSDASLPLRIEAPFNDVLQSRGDDAEYFPASVSYTGNDGQHVEAALEVKTRGNFRNRENVCRFPPLMLDFPRPEVNVTIFAGENRLKLVTHCEPRARYEQYVFLEYLSYRVYNLLSDISLRVRLLELTYADSATGETREVKPAFIIEDIGRLAARAGLTEVGLQRIGRDWYDQEQAVLVAVFQYLVGNTDWSMLIGAPEDACCHNVFPLQNADGALIPVPYDLDVTGLVDPRYGSPPAGLPIRRLTQRLYRGGACPDPAILARVLDRFQAQRAAILDLYASQPELTDVTRRKALAFIEAFYAVLDDSARVQTEFRDECP